MQTVEQRLEALERGQRRWKFVACTLALSIVAAIGIGAADATPGVMRTRKLEVVDSKGVVRCEIATNAEEGSVSLKLNDDGGHPRCVLETFGPGELARGSFEILDGDGHAKCSLKEASGEKGGEFHLRDRKGGDGFAARGYDGSLSLRDPEGKSLIQAFTGPAPFFQVSAIGSDPGQWIELSIPKGAGANVRTGHSSAQGGDHVVWSAP